ncbi:four-carbon acid sugar kinase family protein [Kribbella sp. NPDC004875]|uniref:four-carbon acid sugar kinase family protein n=1 Tax=Kribbella sp. NPDC004875 TaxID=3364107 RepID=UPI0036A62195
MTALVIHADDLTGAAETAALFRHVSPHGTSLQLRSGARGPGLTVIDLDTRNLSSDEAERAARRALTDGTPVFTKLDSMLRGNYAAHLRALDPTEHPVVLAPALPVAGRRVVDGRLLLPDREPIDVFGVLKDLPSSAIGPSYELASSGIAVADATTDEDLDRLVDATWQVPGIRYVGAGGLAAALARRLATGAPPKPSPTAATGVLYVVGTAEPVVHDQIRALHEYAGIDCATVTLDELLPMERLAEGLNSGAGVILKAPVELSDAAVVANTLAAATYELLAHSNGQPALVLTGGHTARTVLDALGIDHLTVVDEIHHGAVLSHTRDGRPVVTRPGSFGERDSFAAIHAVLRPYSVRKATTS